MPLAAQRLVAIDAFRGLTFIVMIWVNELGGVSGISRWLKHMPADSDAMSFTDIVFPAFLFIVGMSIPFAFARRQQAGDGPWALARHTLERALALVLMGLFMVNAEDGYNVAASGMPVALWSLLFYAAAALCWGVYRFDDRPLLQRGLRLAGVLLLIGLAALFHGGKDGSDWLRPQWWGILGLIGWAYLLGCAVQGLTRGRLMPLLAAIALCIGYYALHRLPGLGPLASALLSQDAHAAHGAIVLCGMVCAQIFFDARRNAAVRQRFAEALLFAAALALVGATLRPAFGISKIYATPSWCLYCAAICVLLFSALHALIDHRGRNGWLRWVAPAAANPLVTYLLPFIVLALMDLAGLSLPAPLHQGALGLLWAALYAALIVALVSLLNRRNLRLQL